jgi:hypothetical protein
MISISTNTCLSVKELRSDIERESGLLISFRFLKRKQKACSVMLRNISPMLARDCALQAPQKIKARLAIGPLYHDVCVNSPDFTKPSK